MQKQSQVLPSNYHLPEKQFVELIQTVEGEGYYPHRAIIMEEKYQKSGRTNGLYTGLNMEDGKVSNDNPE
jgi:hypothetical protein